jgi:hypothetical protein
MNSHPRLVVHVLFVLGMMFTVGTVAEAQTYPDTVEISNPPDPPNTQTWISGNGYTISAGVSGSAPVLNMRVTIYLTSKPSTVYLSNTSKYVQMF